MHNSIVTSLFSFYLVSFYLFISIFFFFFLFIYLFFFFIILFFIFFFFFATSALAASQGPWHNKILIFSFNVSTLYYLALQTDW